MPSLDDYLPLAPFTLDELVTAANSILRERPTLHVQGRTVRFYISNGLLPPPSGGPKFARYGEEHLRRIVAIRRWLDEGLTLEQAAERIRMGEHGGETVTHQRRGPLVVQDRYLSVRADATPLNPSERLVRRMSLTRHSALEVSAEADLQRELHAVMKAIQTLVDRQHDST